MVRKMWFCSGVVAEERWAQVTVREVGVSVVCHEGGKGDDGGDGGVGCGGRRGEVPSGVMVLPCLAVSLVLGTSIAAVSGDVRVAWSELRV